MIVAKFLRKFHAQLLYISNNRSCKQDFIIEELASISASEDCLLTNTLLGGRQSATGKQISLVGVSKGDQIELLRGGPELLPQVYILFQEHFVKEMYSIILPRTLLYSSKAHNHFLWNNNPKLEEVVYTRYSLFKKICEHIINFLHILKLYILCNL